MLSDRTQSPGRSAVLREYSDLAESYDRRWAFYVDATVRETLRRMTLEPADRLLDVGCGTGTLLQAISHSLPHARLAGVDPSREMLNVARRRLGHSARLTRGWAEQLPFPDGAFDVVVSLSLFHMLQDIHLALREMARVLRPGGRLVITDWCDDYLACRICDLFLRFSNRAHVRVYGQQEFNELLEAAGFSGVESERYKISWLWGLMTASATTSSA